MTTHAVRVPVTGPVTAECGPVYLRLFPAVEEFIPPDDSCSRPWAWGALCHVTFRIGELVVTKKIKVRHAFGQERPSDDELGLGHKAVLDDLERQLCRHGFLPPELAIIEDA